GESARIRAFVPPEALLLRIKPDVLAEAAKKWKVIQGPHDGRAYALLKELSEHPDDPKLRRDYARLATTAPFRLVREDPTYLRTFRQRSLLGKRTFPWSIE